MDQQAIAIETILTGADKSQYGQDYNEHLLRQYIKYLEMADKISDRRTTANMFFLTLNTAFLSAIGISNAFLEKAGLNQVIIIVMLIAAMAFCYMWFRLIVSYKDLNTAKFKVIHAIEQYLPVKMFDAEWEAVERGNNKKLYFPFSHIEKYIPLVFIALYFTMLLSIVLTTTCSLKPKEGSLTISSSIITFDNFSSNLNTNPPAPDGPGH